MINREHGDRPVLSFQLPPGAPADVTAANEPFLRVTEAAAAHLGALADAKAAIPAARAADKQAAAAALVAGKPVPQPGAKETAALAALAELEALTAAHYQAADEVGNTLAEAIAANAAEWIPTLEAVRDEAVDRYAAALAEAQAALAEMKQAVGAAYWLEHFDLTQARLGHVRPWHGGGGVHIEGENNISASDPALLLTRAAKITAVRPGTPWTKDPPPNPLDRSQRREPATA